jgi:hypothetical protein
VSKRVTSKYIYVERKANTKTCKEKNDGGSRSKKPMEGLCVSVKKISTLFGGPVTSPSLVFCVSVYETNLFIFYRIFYCGNPISLYHDSMSFFGRTILYCHGARRSIVPLKQGRTSLVTLFNLSA